MLDFFLCLCNSIYIFWKSLPAHFNASDNPVFETCNSFVCIIFFMPVEGHSHFVPLHYNTVHWPFFSNTQPSSSCYTQKVPPIIYHPPTKLHGVTHHNTECFLYRHTQHSSCIAYKACIRRYLPESLSRDAPLVIRNVSLLSVAVFCLSEASTLRTVLFCQSLSMLDSVDFPSSAFKRTVI